MFNRNVLHRLLVIVLLIILAVIVSLFDIPGSFSEVQIEVLKYVNLV